MVSNAIQRWGIKPDNPTYPTMSQAYDKGRVEEISLQQLRALAAVAESGSFTLAAEALQLTQPAISHLIKRMEHELGQPLVVRGRRIRMTSAGEMMVDTAVRALRLIDESVGACRSQSQLREGRVVLAVGHLTAGALLPPLLSRFSQQHPALATALLDSTADQMISRILSQEADLGFGSDIGQKHSELATEPLFSERMALFARDDHPLAQRVVIDAKHLDGLPFIHVNPDANIWRSSAVSFRAWPTCTRAWSITCRCCRPHSA